MYSKASAFLHRSPLIHPLPAETRRSDGCWLADKWMVLLHGRCPLPRPAGVTLTQCQCCCSCCGCGWLAWPWFVTAATHGHETERFTSRCIACTHGKNDYALISILLPPPNSMTATACFAATVQARAFDGGHTVHPFRPQLGRRRGCLACCSLSLSLCSE